LAAAAAAAAEAAAAARASITCLYHAVYFLPCDKYCCIDTLLMQLAMLNDFQRFQVIGVLMTMITVT
jgi:hypothetical protein